MAITEENINNTLQMYANPLSIQLNALQRLEESVLEGRSIRDGNNVFTFLLEFMATMTAGATGEAINNFRSLYPSKASTSKDLYKHMSDFDYLNLYSTPATTKITLLFDRNYLINNAAKDELNKSYHKVVIPSQTVFTIGALEFGIHYPIHILIKKSIRANGTVDFNSTTFTVLWDHEDYNPLHILHTNVVEHRFHTVDNTTLLCIEIPIHQFSIANYNETVSTSTGFIKRYEYKDRFYAIRVFENSTGSWKEMHQTLSDTIYDVELPTAKINVLDDMKMVEVVIPQVYLTNGSVGNKIRIQLYTTKGRINTDISNYSQDQFKASFVKSTSLLTDEYSDVLKYINRVQVIPSVSRISGGNNGMSFEQLRNRVIHDSTYDVLITPRDLQAYFEDHGYTITRYIDNVTNRIYFAHKILTDSKGNMVGTGSYNTVFKDSMLKVTTDPYTDEKYIDRYSNVRPVTDDKKTDIDKDKTSVVILPSNMYRYDSKSNSMVLMDDDEVSGYNALTKKGKVDMMNSGIYTFIPFHTKLTTGVSPVCTSYDLMTPQISNMVFAGENPNVATQVSVYSYGISHLDNGSGGYRIVINLYRTSDISSLPVVEAFNSQVIQNIMVVLCASNASGNMCYWIGEHVFTKDESELPMVSFKLDTNYSILDDGNIYLSNALSMYSDVKGAYVGLDSKFEVRTYIRSGLLQGYTGASADYDVPETSGYTWLSTQTMDVTLGRRIDMLHHNINLTVGEAVKELQPTTSFAAYRKPVYARYTSGELGPDEQHKVGMLKFPLEEVHSEGEIILSDINGHVYPPTLMLQQTHPKNTMFVYDSEILNKDIEGRYALLDASSRGTSRVWRKSIKSPDTYATIRYNSNIKQWILEKRQGGTTTTVYRTNEPSIGTASIPEDWYIASDLDNVSTLKMDLNEDVGLSIHNLSLVEPHTSTSWQGNTWLRMEGDVYVYGSDRDSVNGIYHADEDIVNNWTKTLVNGDDVIIHTIKPANNQQGWEMTEKVNDNSAYTVAMAVDTEMSGKPWKLPWSASVSYMSVSPKMEQINSDDTEYKISVKDLLELLVDRVKESSVFGKIKDIRKHVNPTTLKITDPTEGSYAIFVINSDNDVTMPSTIFTEVYVDPANIDNMVGDGNGALYVRDLELDMFNPLDYINAAQLYELYDVYDHASNTSVAEDMLSERYGIPVYIVRKIVAWRFPWIKVLAATSMATIQKYLNTRKIGSTPISRIREIQSLCSQPIKKCGSATVFESYIDQITGVEVVYLEDTKNVELDVVNPLFGENYEGSHKGAIVLVEDGQTKAVSYAPDMHSALSIVMGCSSHNGLAYCIYDKRDSDDYVLKYINPLTHANNGLDCRLGNSAWNTVDKWPWDVDNWVDVNSNRIDESIKTALNSIITTAIVEHGSGDAVIGEDGTIVEDTSTRDIIYNTSLVHMDYKLTLSNELAHRNFRSKMIEALRSNFTTVDNSRVSLLEQTNIFFKPVRTLGIGKFKVGHVETVDMRLDMTIDLRLHVEQRIIANSNLRDSLESNIHAIIAKHLGRGEISLTGISRDILDEFGDSIVYVDVLGINSRNDLQTLVPVSSEFSPYIRQMLYIKDDGTIGVKSGLNIKWVVIS
jgi:hypothetical protein